MRPIALAAALAAGLAALPAAAGTTPLPEGAVRVSYDDLDLTRDPGRATLARRIHAAARTACGQSSNRECVREAAAQAYLNLDIARLGLASRATGPVSR